MEEIIDPDSIASVYALADELQTYALHVSENLTEEDRHVIGRILQILRQMVNILQEIAIAQSTQLEKMVSFQQAYTEVQMQVPTLLVDEKTPLGKKDEKDKHDLETARNTWNQKTQLLGDNVRQLRGKFENEGKTTQNSINTTNQSINQMMELFTILVRQLKELGAMICK